MIKTKDTLGSKGVMPNQSIGVGYVTVPIDEDRENYIKSCYQESSIMMRGLEGNTYTRVSVSRQVLREISFPQDSNGLGSLVVFVTVPKENKMMVVASYDYQRIIADVLHEGQYKIKKEFGDNLAAIDLDAQGTTLNLILKGIAGKMNIFALSPDNDAEFTDFTKGLREIFGTESVTVKSNKKIEMLVEDKDKEAKFTWTYETGVGWTVLDEFENKMEFVDGEIKFNGGNNGGLLNITPTVSRINSIENMLNTLINLYLGHFHIGNLGAPTSTTAAIVGLASLILTKASDIEDTKVKH